MADDKEVGNLLFTQVSIEWEIEDFCSLSEGYNFSPDFRLSDSDTEWYFGVYKKEKTPNWMSLYLYGKFSEEGKCHVVFTLGISKNDGSVYKSQKFEHDFSDESTSQGCDAFLEMSKLKEVLAPNGKLVVFCVVSFLNRSITVDTACQTATTADTLAQNFKDLCLSGRHGDITVKVKDQKFLAHRSILAARSTVFASMFEDYTAEQLSGTVDITDCDQNSFKHFLLFLYTGKVEGIASDNVFSLYKTADKYNIKELKEVCVQFMVQDMSVTSFCDTVFLAALHDESELLKIATEFFIANVKLILPTKEWQIFLKENPTLSNELFIKLYSQGMP